MPRATVALALSALLMSGATLSLVTPVHAASDGDLRIEDGPSDNEGRLEIFHDGEWGAVCDDFFSDRDAGVACEQLGYTGGRSLRGKWPAPGDMSIWLDDVGCTGSESRLDACPHPGWGRHNCAAREAVGVRCSGTRQISETPPAPNPATGLTASDETTTSVGLSWTLLTQPESVTVTRVEVQRQSGTTWSTVATLASDATSYTVTGLTADTTYSFRIRLVASSGNADSDAVSATTLAAPMPATGLSASNSTQTTVDLSWTLPAQPEGVTVSAEEVQQQAADESWATLATLAADATSHTVTGLASGTTYSFRIRLATSSGSADSETVSATTPGPPAAPSNVRAESGHGQVTLRWAAPAVADGITGYEYRQCRGTTDDWCDGDHGFGSWRSAGTSTSYDVTGLRNDQYMFQVRAVAGEVKGAASEKVAGWQVRIPYLALGVGWLHPDVWDDSAAQQERLLYFRNLHSSMRGWFSRDSFTGTSLALEERGEKIGVTGGRRLNFNAGTWEAAADAFQAYPYNNVGSVHLELTGPVTASRTDNAAPFTLFEDLAGRTLPAGTYSLSATTYSQANRSGSAGPKQTVRFTLQPDNNVPSVQLLCGRWNPASNTLSVGVKASEILKGFSKDDVELANVEETDSQMSAVEGLAPVWAAPYHYSLNFTLPEGADGAIQARIAAGVAQDFADNDNTASNVLNLAQNRTVSVADANGVKDATVDFVVRLNAANDCDTVTVDYATADGTAKAGSHYTASSGTLTFGPGETTRTVSVATLDSPLLASGNTFTLRLSNPSGASLGGNAPTGTIWDGDVAAPKPATGLTASNAPDTTSDGARTTVDLSWTLPAQHSGVTVTGLEVQQQSGTSWSTIATLAAGATSHTVRWLTAGTSYSFRIRLATSSGDADSEPVSWTTAAGPRAASGLTASNVTQTSLDLGWTLPTQPEGVTVSAVEVQQQSGGSWTTVATLAADAASHTVTGLAADTSYTFRIRLATNSGNADSQPLSTASLAPAKPIRHVYTLPSSLTSIKLAWLLPRQSPGVTVSAVEVQVLPERLPPWRTVASLAPVAETDGLVHDLIGLPSGTKLMAHEVIGLTPGKVYMVRIRLVTNSGNPDSRTLTLRKSVTKPVTDFSASNATRTTVDLSWTLPAEYPAAPLMRGVMVQQRGADGDWTTVAPIEAQWESKAVPMSYTVTGLTPGTSYTFRIRLVANAYADSESVSTTTLGRSLNPVVGLAASNPTETTVDLAWTLPAQPAGVTVSGLEVQQQSGGSWTTVASLAAAATSHTVTGLTEGTTYAFRVRLAANDGTADSETVSATALAAPNPATGVTVSNTSRTAIDLSWTLPAQGTGVTVSGVEVQYKLGARWSTAWSTVATLAADATSHTVSGLTPGTSYAFRIRLATNNGHADSQPVSATALAPPNPATGITVSNMTAITWLELDGSKLAGWSFDLSWTLPVQPEGVRVTDVEAYQVYDNGAMTGGPLGANRTSMQQVLVFAPATTHTFLIRLETNNGHADSEVSVTTPTEDAPPAKPATGLAASNATQTTMDLSWTLPAQGSEVTVTGVAVQQQGADNAWATVATLAADATSHTVSGLTAGTTYSFRVRLVTSSGNADSDALEARTADAEALQTRLSGSVPPPEGVKDPSRTRSPGESLDEGCRVEVAVEFLDEDGDAVAVDSLVGTHFTVENGTLGTPVADADGLRWTVPVRATTNERGLLRVRLPATARWRAAEQVFHNRGAGVCAAAARWELATLLVEEISISPSFNSATTSYTAETTDADAEVVAEAVYTDATLTIAPVDADEEADGHRLALAEGETEVTVTVTPGDGSAAQTYTVTVTREAAAEVLTGFVLVDASTDADLGAVTDGGTVTVSANGSYGIRAAVEAGAQVGSVVLSLAGPGETDTHTRTENVAPYSLYGDEPGGASGRAEHGRALPAGSYTLSATAYAERAGAGEVLGTLTAAFTVALEAAPTSVLTGFTLVDTSDQSTVAALADSADIDLGGRSGGSFAIRADVASDATVGSVALSLSGAKTVSATENLAPYSLWGDRDDGNGGRALDGATLPAGTYTLSATAYAERGASGSTLGTLSVSFEVLAPALLSVADAQAEEGTDATLDFAVTLDRSSTGTVTVAYATSDGTAKAGSDYTATSGTLTFQPGEREKTVSVPVLADDHDEGSETLTLRLSNAEGANIADGEATGTITNDGAIPEAWLARFGRTVTGQVLDAVQDRLAASRQAGAQMSLAGQVLPSWQPGDAAAANSGTGARPGRDSGSGAGGDAAAAVAAERAEAEARAGLASMTAWLAHMEPDPGPGQLSGASPGAGAGPGVFARSPGRDPGSGAGPGFESRALTERDFITGTSFALTAKAGDGRGAGHVSLWGRGSIAGFDGREGALTVDGKVTTGLIGADWASDPGSGSGRWIAGLAIGHSTGTGGWRGANGSAGKIEATLTGLYPYAGMDLTERLSVWAAAGWGAGEVTVTPDGEAGLTADLTMAMGAAGLRSELLRPGEGNGFALAVKGDARFTRTSSDAARSEDGNLAASEADVWLLRTGIEGSRPVALGDSGATLTPSFEIALRLDGGDAETGFGADLGGGVAFSDPENGVALDLRARGLVAHESPGFREWGASLQASWDPQPSTDRGLSLSLTQSWGASPAGGMDALLSRETLAGLAANDNAGKFEASSRLEGELGYGLPAFGGAFTSTPNIGFALSDGGAREWRLGWRLTSAIGGDPGFEVSLDATRSEPANDDVSEHGVTLKAAIRW